MRLKKLHAIGSLLLLFLLMGCGSDNENNNNPRQDDGILKFISGQVIDGNTGIPVENAMIRTSPPTEVELTDRDGMFIITDTVFKGDVYDVTATQVGYDSVTHTVSVANGGSAGTDFSIVTSINGLVSSAPVVEIPLGQNTGTFLLSSTLDTTRFSFQTTNPAFVVTPSQGTLTKNQLMVIEVNFTPTTEQSDTVTGELIANASNGGTGVEVIVRANLNVNDLMQPEDPFQVVISDPENPQELMNDDSHNTDDDTTVGEAPVGSGEVNLSFGDTVSGTLETNTDVAIYHFDALAGDELFLPYGRRTVSLLNLELRGSDGEIISSSRGVNGVFIDTIPSDGVYSLWINNPQFNNGGDFDFTLQRLNNPTGAVSINFADNITTNIDSFTDISIHAFSAEAGTKVVIPFARATVSLLQVELRNSNGVVVAEARGTSGSLTGEIAQSGNYFLWIRNPQFNNGGEYTFSLQRAN